jgi:hypothetical protein
MSRPLLVVELIVLFVGLPLVFDQLLVHGYRRLLFPALWVLAAAALVWLRRDPAFDGATLWSLRVSATLERWLLLRMAVGIAVIGWLSHRYAPEGFLRLPREMPWLYLGTARSGG